MREWFTSLRVTYKIALIEAVSGIIGFLLLVPFFFFGYMDIPLGVLLGGELIGLLYFFSGLAEEKDDEGGRATLTIIMMGVRLAVIAGVLILIIFMSKKWGLNIFNPFAYVAIYTVSVVINAIVMIKERSKK